MKKARGKNKEIVKVVEKMKKARVKTLREDEWKIESKLISKKEKIYMLKNKELRIDVIQLYHNVLVIEYKGR